MEQMFRSADTDNSGFIDFNEFVAVMTSSFESSQAHRQKSSRERKKLRASEEHLPFQMCALAYRRRKLIDSTFRGSPEVLRTVRAPRRPPRPRPHEGRRSLARNPADPPAPAPI